jgi:tetratricopeptide (TPR) repeat protein
MRRALLALPLLLAAGLYARAETPEETFSRGNAAFEARRFEEAAQAYRTVIRYGITDARVEYNLGCASYRLDRLGEAILHFERALRLSPTDPDVTANLALARSRCFDRVEPGEVAAPVRVVRSLQDRAGPDRQAVGLVALVWAAASLVAWRSSRTSGWNAAAAWTLAAIVAAGALLGASWLSTRSRLEAPVAVVLESSVEVRAGPGEQNAVLFTAHEGLSLEVRTERADWVQVSLPNGLNGWVPAASVGRG